MFVLKKRTIIIVSVLLLSVFTTIFCLSALSIKGTTASSNSIKIVIDAGHGGIDDGAIGSTYNTKESEVNLNISLFLKEYFIDAGITPVLTRSSSAGLYGVASSSLKKRDMEKRRQIILDSSPTMVISIHLNKYSLSSRRGAQVFYKKGDEKGKILAECIQNSFNSMSECVKKTNALTGDYYILNCSSFPSVICECGFLSNQQDEELLRQESYQKEIAYSIFKGAIDYMSIETVKFF